MHRAACRGLTITDAELGLEAAPYTEAAIAWVRSGWTPTNPLLRNAARDGASTPGAVEGQFAAGNIKMQLQHGLGLSPAPQRFPRAHRLRGENTLTPYGIAP